MARRAPDRGDAAPGLLVVSHSRAGSTAALCGAAVRAARDAVGDEVAVRELGAFDAGPEDVVWSDALLLCTPANFGYMSGAVKDFFERVYYPCLERTVGLPYALVAKGSTDVDGAIASVQRIAAGLRWRLVLAPVAVVGDAGPDDVARVEELGATFAAGVAAGIF